MEVHHHPHVEKRKLKEYLLEGLMIFIAVVLGFIAESLSASVIARSKILSENVGTFIWQQKIYTL